MVTVEVDAIRLAMSNATFELSQVCDCVISYESPEWAYAGNLRRQPEVRDGVVRSTATSRLRVSVSGTLPLTRETAADLLQRLIDEDARSGSSARYQLVEGRTRPDLGHSAGARTRERACRRSE